MAFSISVLIKEIFLHYFENVMI